MMASSGGRNGGCAGIALEGMGAHVAAQLGDGCKGAILPDTAQVTGGGNQCLAGESLGKWRS